MKILIDNRTNLSIKQTGYLIDTIQANKKTADFKKTWLICELEYLEKTYHIETLQMKRYLKVFIIEK